MLDSNEGPCDAFLNISLGTCSLASKRAYTYGITVRIVILWDSQPILIRSIHMPTSRPSISCPCTLTACKAAYLNRLSARRTADRAPSQYQPNRAGQGRVQGLVPEPWKRRSSWKGPCRSSHPQWSTESPKCYSMWQSTPWRWICPTTLTSSRSPWWACLRALTIHTQ